MAFLDHGTIEGDDEAAMALRPLLRCAEDPMRAKGIPEA
jgi:hypothetical protein